MIGRRLDEGKTYRIGLIGNKTTLMPFWELFISQGSGRVLSELGIVAAALPGNAAGEGFGPGMELPVYPGFKAMLDAHPDINLVIESVGDPSLLAELRAGLPSHVGLVERTAASFFIRLLSTEQMWMACRVDLMHTQALLRSIIDQFSEEILFMSPEGRILDVNESVARHLGLTKRDIVGRLPQDVMRDDRCRGLETCDSPFAATVRNCERSEAVVTQVDDEGRMRYFRIYTYPICDEQGNLVNVVVMRRDITRRTEMEQRLQQSEKLASIGQLSTYIAHEIRNPLFAISGFANALLRQPNLDVSAREKLSIILEESRRLDGILKSIANFARPTEAREQAVDVNRTVEHTVEIMGADCEKAGARLAIRLAPDLARAKADPELIKQCLINLLRNAIESMPDGGDVTVTTGMSGTFVALSVQDTGVGIPAELRDKVFSPFFSTKGKGSGLGLAMIRKIMDDIGGDVDLSSVEGRGTTVTLLLPPALAVAEHPPAA